ncbi:MAG: sialate O-acetylesterase [Planctomycetia bacterium]|nr:sialate O-acetylesterase [Planctomycetia bacterium]
MRLPRMFASSFSGIAAAVWLSVCGVASAEVKLPRFFSDHMVLQRETKAPLWGTAAAGEKITVRFRDQEQKTEADAKGNWRVEFTGLKAGGPDELTIAATNTITLKDILVGEVWVGSGQSNMQGAVVHYAPSDPELAKLAATAYPTIRGCTVSSGWNESNPKNNANFSAILFAFAVRVNEDLKVPVGMLLGAVGGTPSGAWVSQEAVAGDPEVQKQIAEYAKGYDALMKHYEEVDLPTWEKANAAAKAAGKPDVRKPAPYDKPGMVFTNLPGYLYDAYIRPFVGYGIRGVLWDQGESGTRLGGVDQTTLMGTLIRSWRAAWNVGDFAFIYVQKPSGNGCAWDVTNPVTSQAQRPSALPAAPPGTTDGLYVETHVKIMKYPNVGMAISSDLGPGVHPSNKSGYGSRAGAVALGMTYGKPIEYYGPLYASHTVEGDKVRVKFTHIGQGLAFKHGEKLQGFAIAGDDKVFRWAEAVIDGDTVVLSNAEVAKPTAVRYAWAHQRTWANLFNKDGLPAVTFRTDSW